MQAAEARARAALVPAPRGAALGGQMNGQSSGQSSGQNNETGELRFMVVEEARLSQAVLAVGDMWRACRLAAIASAEVCALLPSLLLCAGGATCGVCRLACAEVCVRHMAPRPSV